jgi:hypothetical protein
MFFQKGGRKLKMKHAEAVDFINFNVLGSNEVQEMLMVSKVRLKAIVDAGKLKPVKELKREYLFFLPEVEQLKQEMLKDSRTNLYKSH